MRTMGKPVHKWEERQVQNEDYGQTSSQVRGKAGPERGLWADKFLVHISPLERTSWMLTVLRAIELLEALSSYLLPYIWVAFATYLQPHS
jgi:hypothetical protein